MAKVLKAGCHETKHDILVQRNNLADDAVWYLNNWYLEQQGSMTVDSFADETNGNSIRLELNLELTEVQNP